MMELQVAQNRSSSSRILGGKSGRDLAIKRWNIPAKRQCQGALQSGAKEGKSAHGIPVRCYSNPQFASLDACTAHSSKALGRPNAPMESFFPTLKQS